MTSTANTASSPFAMAAMSSTAGSFASSPANKVVQQPNNATADHQAKELIRRLTNHEQIIKKFFAVPNLLPFLERKLYQLEEMIAQFPDNCETVADGWRDKVTRMWQQLATYSMGPSAASGNVLKFTDPGDFSLLPAALSMSELLASLKSLSNSSSPNSPISISKSKQPKTSLMSTAGAGMATASTGLLRTPPGFKPLPILSTPIRGGNQNKSSGLLQTPSRHSSQQQQQPSDQQPEPNLTGPIQTPTRKSEEEVCKQTLRESIERNFAEMPEIQSGTDMEVIKTLLIEVAKATRSLAPYENDLRLHQDVFNIAFQKLPSKMRDQFLTIYGVHQNGITLKNLIAFLEAEIVAQHSKTVWLLSMMPSSRKSHSKQQSKRGSIGPASQRKWNSVTNGGATTVVNSNYCKYCKTFGHKPTDCLYIKELLCFNCFQRGHTKKQCTNIPLL